MRNIKRHFPLGGMVVVTCLLLAGILMIVFIGSLPIYIFGVFFTFVGAYCWYEYICNVLIRPQENVLYLKEKYDGEYTFIDDKGKKFIFYTKKEYVVDKYYVVLKSKDYIEKIIRVSESNFEILEKRRDSYFLNCYLPVGNFENIFLLPIIYVIALFSISLIFWQGVLDFNALIMAVVAIYLIVYDFIYKEKKKKSVDENKEVDDTKLLKSFEIFINFIRIFMIAVICFVLLYIFIFINGVIAKIFMLPFLLCACCLFWQTIASIKGNEKMVKILGKLYTIIFLMYWFGIIFVGIYASFTNDEPFITLFLLPFIAAGIYVGYKSFKK